MTTPDPEATSGGVREEYFLDQGMDVEAEKGPEEPAAEIAKPWNPEQIRVNTKQFSLRNVLDMIDDESLELAPDFQRGQVWKRKQKSQLIESVLLQIPLPAFYFAEDSNGLMRVVDGLQRLSTINDFVRGGDEGTQKRFPLRDLEYLELDGKYFDDLPAPWKRRINNAQIMVHVVDPTTPPDVMYDIFKRINTGGTPLNSQEIRHCMSKARSRDILKRMTMLPEFNKATNGMSGHPRMSDREMALRFTAFRLLGVGGYAEHAAIDLFLQHTTTLLDDPANVSGAKVDELVDGFRRAMSHAYLVFGDHAFRKWPLGYEYRNPVNRALFETWSIALAQHDTADLKRRKDAVINAARELMTSDHRYLESITSSTGDVGRVRYRFSATEQAAEAGK